MKFAGYNTRHRIYVTEEDDRNSEPENSRHCAVAVAIGRQLEWATHVDVNSQRIRLLDPDNREAFAWETPDVALVTAIRKDEKMPFKPVSFVLDESKARITEMKTYTARNSKQGQRTGGADRKPRTSTSHRTMGMRADLYKKAMGVS